MLSLVPLAPLYRLRGRRRQGEGRSGPATRSWTRCASSLVEAMEAGGCGWSSQISGDRGNVQRDYDGTPMVTDAMTEREIVAFSRALRPLGRGTTQITGLARDRGADRPRERPTDHLERAGADRRREPARRVALPAPRDHRPARRAEPAGRCAGASPRRRSCASSRRSSSRTTTSWTSSPRGGTRPLGTLEEKIAKYSRPGAPAGAEGGDRHDGRRLRRRPVSDRRDHGELDRQRRARTR